MEVIVAEITVGRADRKLTWDNRTREATDGRKDESLYEHVRVVFVLFSLFKPAAPGRCLKGRSYLHTNIAVLWCWGTFQSEGKGAVGERNECYDCGLL